MGRRPVRGRAGRGVDDLVRATRDRRRELIRRWPGAPRSSGAAANPAWPVAIGLPRPCQQPPWSRSEEIAVGDDVAASNVNRAYSLAGTCVAIFTFTLLFLYPPYVDGDINPVLFQATLVVL